MTMNGVVSPLLGNGRASEWMDSPLEAHFIAWTRESHHVPEVQSRWRRILQCRKGLYSHDVESVGWRENRCFRGTQRSRVPAGHNEYSMIGSCSPSIGDTKYLFSASMDSTCHIWDVMTGRVVNVIKLDIPIRCLAVSEGDQYLCLCTMSFAGEAVFPRTLPHP